MSQSTFRIFGCQLLYWYFFNFSCLNFSNPSFFFKYCRSKVRKTAKDCFTENNNNIKLPHSCCFCLLFFFWRKWTSQRIHHALCAMVERLTWKLRQHARMSSHQVVVYQLSLWMSTSFPSNTNWLKAAKTSMTYWTYLVNYH